MTKKILKFIICLVLSGVCIYLAPDPDLSLWWRIPIGLIAAPIAGVGYLYLIGYSE